MCIANPQINFVTFIKLQASMIEHHNLTGNFLIVGDENTGDIQIMNQISQPPP
jgi:hypothetical protein